MVGHPGAPHAANVGDERDLLGDRGRCLVSVGVPLLADGAGSPAFGFIALILASVNIFGGFLVTSRMLAMYKKKG